MKNKKQNIIFATILLFGILSFSNPVSASTATKTLYAWARDLAGNISLSQSDSVDITISGNQTYYLSPAGNDTTGNGTINNPWFSLNKAWTVVAAGDTVYMRGGTYSYPQQQVMINKNGTVGNLIKLWAYQNEIPIITKGSTYSYNDEYGYGVYLSGNYIHFKGLDISGFTQETPEVWHGLRTIGSHNIYEQLNIHHNGGGMLISETSTDNLVLNSDFHHISDPLSPTQYNNGDGLEIGYTYNTTNNTVRGCRFWWNTDDGLDLFRNEGFVTVENSWAFYNGYIPDTFTPAREELGDGSGFKLGDQFENHSSEIMRVLKNNVVFKNRGSGFFDNAIQSRVLAHNNTAYLNGFIGIVLGAYVNDVKNNIGYSNYYDGCIGTISNESNNTFIGNCNQNPLYAVTNSDFSNLDASQLLLPRQSDGSLPDISFLHLAQGSDLVNTGTNVGLPYNGSAPDLGAFESSYISSSATYYISPTGSDTTGTGSSGSPWRTLYKACNTVTNSGSIIHVNAGTYNETQQCALALGISIEGEGLTSIIKSNISTQYVTTILMHSDVEGVNGNQHISNIKMDGNNVAWGAILINGRSNVSIHDSTFINFAYTGVTYNGAVSYINNAPSIYATGNTFYNNIITNCSEYDLANGFGNGGLQIGGQDGMLVYGNNISQVGRAIGHNGYPIKYYSDGYNKGLKIYNNTVTKAPFSGLNNDFDFALEFWNHRGGVEIYNNTIIGGIDVGGDSTIKGSYNYSVSIHDNIIGPISMGEKEEVGVWLERNCSDVYINNNNFRNITSAVFFVPASTDTVSNIEFIGNVVNGIGTASGSWLGYGIRWSTVNGADGTIVNNIKINNNIFNGNTVPNNLAGIQLPDIGTATNITIRNNIIWGFDFAPIYSNTSGTISNLSIENNNFYQNVNNNNVLIAGNIPTSYVNQNNLKVDPLFISSSDFHLQSNSPMIDHGINVGLPYNGSAPDIGAFETN